jgi:hypothetical protein
LVLATISKAKPTPEESNAAIAGCFLVDVRAPLMISLVILLLILKRSFASCGGTVTKGVRRAGG